MKPFSDALINHLQQEIIRQGGQISFAEFMELALYHPEFGYYNNEQFDIGKHGDFTTAPTLSPLFAKCLAHFFLEISTQLQTKNILELGAGTGQLALDLLRELSTHEALPSHYFIYEISPTLRKKQHDLFQSHPDLLARIHWLDALPENFSGLIIANEVLDALPVHCFRVEEEGIKERCVGMEKGKLTWKISPPTSPLLTEKAEKIRENCGLFPGYESEINLYLPSMIDSLTRSLRSGLILLIDYGYGRNEYYHPERMHGTLTCFYQHKRHNDPLIHPGHQDITAHVDFTSVIETAVDNHCELAGFTTQAGFLLACGLMELAAEEEKKLSAVEAFHAHQAIKLLTLPTEMGERVKVMGLSKHIKLPLSAFLLQDRRRDL